MFLIRDILNREKITGTPRHEKAEAWCHDQFLKDDFATRESMRTKLAPYRVGPEHLHQYSYSVRICGDVFVEEIGKQGNQTIDEDKRHITD